MVKEGNISDMTKAFEEGKVDCFTVIQQSSHHTIVHEAITLNRREFFKLCQIYGADWNRKDANGVTPLMKAVALNRAYFVQKLLEKDIKLGEVDNLGRSAKQYAQYYQNYDLVQKIDEAMQLNKEIP